MLNFFPRRSANRQVITTLYHNIAKAALSPELFGMYRIADTLSGRFESLALHMAVVLRHLRNWPHPAPDVAGDLTDYYFSQLDDALRELGTSDNKVPKKMKEMAGAFLRGAEAYDAALGDGDARVLHKILVERFGSQLDAAGFAHYIYGLDEAVYASNLERILKQGPSFPKPSIPVGAPT